MSGEGAVQGHKTPLMAEIDSRFVRRYLLGQLDERAQAALEDRAFAEPEVVEAVECVETDLLDDYVRGRLDAGERDAFEAHYLRTEGHRERLRFARALLAVADRSAIPAQRGSKLPRWLAAAAALALVGGWAGWLRVSREGASPRVEVATTQPAPAPDRRGTKVEPPAAPSSAPGPRASISVLLSPMILRGEGQQAPVVVPPGTVEVELRLPADVTEYKKARATVEIVGGAIVWAGEVALRDAASGLARARVPADRLMPQDYIVTLEGLTSGGAWEEVQRYSLRIAGAPVP